MSWSIWLPDRERDLFFCIDRARHHPDRCQEVSPLPLLGDHCRLHHLRHCVGGFCDPFIRHWLHRRLAAPVRLRHARVGALVLVGRHHLGQHGEHARDSKRFIGQPSLSLKHWELLSATGSLIPAVWDIRAGHWCLLPHWRSPPRCTSGRMCSRLALFWAAFILTRPLGATLGDFLDKPLDHGGLALSRPIASAIILAIMIGLIVVLPQRAGVHPRDRVANAER